MANMSYCRFENTLSDLRDCRDAIGESSPEELLEEASDYEKRAYHGLIEMCREIAEAHEEE